MRHVLSPFTASPPTMPSGAPPAARLTPLTLGGWSFSHASRSQAPTPVLGPSKPLALLIYLSAMPGHAARREHLADLLWADLGTEAARHALCQTLLYLRRRTGTRIIRANGDEIVLHSQVNTDRDAVALARRVRDAEPTTEAGWQLLIEALACVGDRLGTALETMLIEGSAVAYRVAHLARQEMWLLLLLSAAGIPLIRGDLAGLAPRQGESSDQSLADLKHRVSWRIPKSGGRHRTTRSATRPWRSHRRTLCGRRTWPSAVRWRATRGATPRTARRTDSLHPATP